MNPRSSLPAWARPLLRVVASDRRADVEADLDELYRDRRGRYGRLYAQRRLCGDLTSLWRGRRRGGSMLQDMRFALRLFRRHPVPVGIAVGGLAIAIGVVTSVFSLINASLLRPFGMDDPTTVVSVNRGTDHHWPYWSMATFRRMQAESALTRVEGMLYSRVRFTPSPSDGGDYRRPVLFVSGSFLQTFGGRPALGRALTLEDDVAGAPPVAVVSHHFWSTRLSGDASIVGRPVWLNESPITIVGVLEREFTGPTDLVPSFWLPLVAFDALRAGRLADEEVGVFARLAPAATMAAAQDSLHAIVSRGVTPSPGAHPPQVILYSASSPVSGPADVEAYVVAGSMLAVVGLVLALACANAANLLLAGASTRAREIGVRLALGSTRTRLLRQMVTESVVLGVIAGAVGLFLSYLSAPIIGAALQMPAEFNASVDIRVLLFAIVVAVTCGVGAGIAPARFGARGDVIAALKSQSGRAGQARRSSRIRTAFVAFQAAASAFLLLIAALLTRNAIVTMRTDVGFDADKLLAVSLSGPRKDFQQMAFLDAAVAALRDMPSVERVSVAQTQPFGRTRERGHFRTPDRVSTFDVTRSDAEHFVTTGLRTLRGRTFTTEEVSSGAPVAVVSAGVARAIFGDRDPIGQTLVRITPKQDIPLTVVGVVADAVTRNIDRPDLGRVHLPLSQTPDNLPGLTVRTTSPGAAAHAIEDALRRIDARVQPTTDLVREGLEQYLGNARLFAWLAASTAGLALILAVLGVYGVTAFIVGQRTQEISVRMAMGATPTLILRLLLKDGFKPIVAGLAVGVAAALLAGRVIASELLGLISPYDPIAISVAVTTLLLSALVAVVVPSRRAARVEPASVLRGA